MFQKMMNVINDITGYPDYNPQQKMFIGAT